VKAKFPPIAVKLKGETAAMKPSIPRYLIEFNVTEGSSLTGWYLVNSFAACALNLKIIIQRKFR
jgi:hypothetical protein